MRPISRSQASFNPLQGVISSLADAADAVIHTAFGHAGVYEDAVQMDRAAINAMTDALAGSHKVFIMSSGTGFLGNTGPIPVSEEYPFDPDAPSRARCHNERVRDNAHDVRQMMSVQVALHIWQAATSQSSQFCARLCELFPCLCPVH